MVVGDGIDCIAAAAEPVVIFSRPWVRITLPFLAKVLPQKMLPT